MSTESDIALLESRGFRIDEHGGRFRLIRHRFGNQPVANLGELDSDFGSVVADAVNVAGAILEDEAQRLADTKNVCGRTVAPGAPGSFLVEFPKHG
jgi:hypothetical protein